MIIPSCRKSKSHFWIFPKVICFACLLTAYVNIRNSIHKLTHKPLLSNYWQYIMTRQFAEIIKLERLAACNYNTLTVQQYQLVDFLMPAQYDRAVWKTHRSSHLRLRTRGQGILSCLWRRLTSGQFIVLCSQRSSVFRCEHTCLPILQVYVTGKNQRAGGDSCVRMTVAIGRPPRLFFFDDRNLTGARTTVQSHTS